jgi:outer membrane immunogenic protein
VEVEVEVEMEMEMTGMTVTSRVVGSSSLALAAAASSGAMAADLMPLVTKAPVVDPVVSWQGLYVGASLGATWLNSGFDDRAVSYFGYTGAGSVGTKTNVSNVGWLGGLQAGYNFQHRSFVYGFEADIAWLGGGSASSSGALPGAYAGYTATRASKIDALATFRARIGIDFNGTLPYLTGGFAVADIKDTYSTGIPRSGSGYASATTSVTSWTPGIVLGGGIEHQITPRWSVRGEVLWVGFQDKSVSAPPTGGGNFGPGGAALPLNSGPVKFSNDITLVKFGTNFRF